MGPAAGLATTPHPRAWSHVRAWRSCRHPGSMSAGGPAMLCRGSTSRNQHRARGDPRPPCPGPALPRHMPLQQRQQPRPLLGRRAAVQVQWLAPPSPALRTAATPGRASVVDALHTFRYPGGMLSAGAPSSSTAAAAEGALIPGGRLGALCATPWPCACPCPLPLRPRPAPWPLPYPTEEASSPVVMEDERSDVPSSLAARAILHQ
jgi:hypothetical protein